MSVDVVGVQGHTSKQSSTSSQTSNTLSTKGLEDIVECLRCQCYRDTTKRNYYNVWHSFNKFYLRLDEKPMSWENRIILFIGYLIDQGRQSATIKSYVSALRVVLKQDKVKLQEDEFLITSLT